MSFIKKHNETNDVGAAYFMTHTRFENSDVCFTHTLLMTFRTELSKAAAVREAIVVGGTGQVRGVVATSREHNQQNYP